MKTIGMSLMLRSRPLNLFIKLNTWLWNRAPAKLQNTTVMRSYGMILHKLVRHGAKRMQFHGTFFFRNRPQLELIRRLSDKKPKSGTLSIAILGCSVGAEIYSILSTIRSTRPDLDVHVCAVDNSYEVLNVAKDAIYTSQTCDVVGSAIFDRMTEVEFNEMFEGDRREARVKPHIRGKIRWQLGDAGDPGLIRVLGLQDLVVASNFLCHMPPSEAEHCLRNIAEMVGPGGYLFVTGIDLDVRERVARDLRWQPVLELIEKIHEGDPSVRADWPCKWWGLEPLNKKRNNWPIRYATVFQPKKRD
jgi:chemotaxis methyl-accepting protein methylase